MRPWSVGFHTLHRTNLILGLLLMVCCALLGSWLVFLTWEHRLPVAWVLALVLALGFLLILGGVGLGLAQRRRELSRNRREEEDNRHETAAEMETSLLRVNDELVREVAERKRVEVHLLRRENILQAAARALSMIASMRSRDLTIQELLALLGGSLSASRSVYFETSEDENRRDKVRLAHGWKCSSDLHLPEDAEGFEISWAPDYLRWHTLLSCGIPVSGPMQGFPACEQARFGDWHLGSMLLVPVLGRERFWGFLGFEDVVAAREWIPGEISALSSVATSLGEVLDREQASEELRRSKEKAEMAEVKAQRLAREAEEASRAKGEFLATMSHEIRTPMNAVIGMASLLGETALDGEQTDMVETIRSSGETLLELINDILDFSKIESGRIELEAIAFDLRVTLEETLDLVAERAHAKGLQVAMLWEPGLPECVVGDPSRIRQVVLNLLSNAVKFTPSGDICIHARREPGEAGSASLRVSVSDSGIGLTAAQISKLFQPFTQADATTTRLFGGTGLGLSICRKLVERMGGRIGVDSQLGKGSQFWFQLDLQEAELPTAPTGSAGRLEGRRVLVVDSHALERTMLTQMLEACGMRVDAVPNAMEAGILLSRAIAQGMAVDVVVIELSGDVDEALRTLRMAAPAGLPRLVALSTLGRKGEAQRARKAGFQVYLPKPAKMQLLRNALSEVLGGDVDHSHAGLVTRHTLAEQDARGRWRILVAEDNQVNQKVLVRMLSKLGYRCDVVANGLEAVVACRRGGAYHLILMDCQMPEMDGWEATRKIRETERTGEARRTQILALTADVLEGVEQSCLEAGMDGYLSKPISIGQLAEVLGERLDGDPPSTFPLDGEAAWQEPSQVA